MKAIRLLFLILSIMMSFTLVKAQQTKSHFRKGNELYKEGKYNEAEIEYRKGLSRQPGSWTGNYNLANSLYKQKRFEEASAILDSLAPNATADAQKATVYHNLGNAYLENKDYQKSVDAYKKSLKINPKDEDTRYNLSYALKKLQQQQQQQNQQQQKKQQEQKQDQQKKPKEQPQKEDKKQQISREEAERILDALNREEKELRKRTEKKDGKALAPANGKDW
jgi:Ca-activated chloride channel homolog